LCVFCMRAFLCVLYMCVLYTCVCVCFIYVCLCECLCFCQCLCVWVCMCVCVCLFVCVWLQPKTCTLKWPLIANATNLKRFIEIISNLCTWNETKKPFAAWVSTSLQMQQRTVTKTFILLFRASQISSCPNFGFLLYKC
jgi:hypothetical protein